MDDHDRDEAAFRKLLGGAEPVQPSDIFEKKLKAKFAESTRARRPARRSPMGRVGMMAATLLVAYFGINMMVTSFQSEKTAHQGNNPPDDFSGVEALWADEAVPQEYSLTIFNDNLAVVRDQRLVRRIPQGNARLEFRGVAESIIPESVRLSSITHPGRIAVLEQNYHYDLASRHSLMQNYVDGDISYLDGSTWRTGKLLGHGGSLIVHGDDGVRITWDGVPVKVPEPKRGILTRPTLRWTLDNEVPGEHQAQIAYMTRGLSWTADHNVVVDEAKKLFSLDSWVTVTNYSGASFPKAKLKFMAGDVNILVDDIEFTDELVMMDAAPEASANATGAAQQISQKAFSEFHLYTLNSQTDLPDRSIKQVRFAHKGAVKYRDAYTLQLARSTRSRHAMIHVLRFDNKEEEGAGIPLPAGRVRLNFGIPGDRELIGIRHMDHTPVEEEVSWVLGQTLRVGKKVTLTERVRTKSLDRHSWKVELRNHHHQDAPIEIRVPLARGNETLVEVKGHDVTRERDSASTELIRLTLKPEQEIVLRISALTTR